MGLAGLLLRAHAGYVRVTGLAARTVDGADAVVIGRLPEDRPIGVRGRAGADGGNLDVAAFDGGRAFDEEAFFVVGTISPVEFHCSLALTVHGGERRRSFRLRLAGSIADKRITNRLAWAGVVGVVGYDGHERNPHEDPRQPVARLRRADLAVRDDDSDRAGLRVILAARVGVADRGGGARGIVCGVDVGGVPGADRGGGVPSA